ncbi:MAG: NADH-quinone oxidoreductase subunit L [Planctomycetota bacterium]
MATTLLHESASWLMAAGQLAAEPSVGGVAQGPWWAWLVPGLPIVGLILATLSAIGGVKSKAPAFLTVGCLAGAFVTTVALYMKLGTDTVAISHAWDWLSFSWGDGPGQSFHAGFSLYLDSLTLYWMLFVTGLATLIALYASEYMSHDVGLGYCRFFAAFNLFVFSMACLVMGDNLLLLFLGWEGVGLCSYLLIGYFYKKPSAVAAAKKAFIMNRIGDLGLLLGIFLTFAHFGTIEYRELFALAQPYIDALKAGDVASIPFEAQMIPVLLMIGAFGKSAQLPLYVWLPDAMEGPTPVSALIHAATMVTAGVYLIARTYPLFLISEYALPIVAWVGALTALLAATIGMAQFDIKRIMAYSTVSQLGYMFCGLAVLSATGGAFHVLTHAFFKATLFLACGAVMHGFAGQLDLRKLSGVGFMKGWGIVGLAMFIGCLNLAGFPFTAGYFSKDMILAESFVTPGMSLIGWILLLTAGLTAYYTFRVFFRVFIGPKHYEPGDELHDHDDGHGGHAHGEEHLHDAGEHGDHHAPGFHPHAPGWAINTVLATLAVVSLLAASLYFIGGDDTAKNWPYKMVQSSTAYQVKVEGAPTAAFLTGGHADHGPHGHSDLGPADDADGHTGEHSAAHGSFLGMDPHKVMYYVSAVVGFVGIAVAFLLHFVGRKEAATSLADRVNLGGLQIAAQNKWYVDEIYHFLVVRPLLVISHIFHLLDRLLVDGLVNLAGFLPRAFAQSLRPSQSGQLQGYAAGMAAGVALLAIVVMVLTARAGGVL